MTIAADEKSSYSSAVCLSSAGNHVVLVCLTRTERANTRFLRKCALPGRDEIVTLYFTSTYISTYAGRFWKALYEKGRFVGGGRKSMVEGFERCARRLRAAQSAVSK